MSFANAAANAKQFNNQADQTKLEETLKNKGLLDKYKAGEITAADAYAKAGGTRLKFN